MPISLHFGAIRTTPTFKPCPGVNTLMTAKGNLPEVGDYSVEAFKLPGLPDFYANFNGANGFVQCQITPDPAGNKPQTRIMGEGLKITEFVQKLSNGAKDRLIADSESLLKTYDETDHRQDFPRVIADLLA